MLADLHALRYTSSPQRSFGMASPALLTAASIAAQPWQRSTVVSPWSQALWMQHPRLGAALDFGVRGEGSHRHTEGLPGSQCSSSWKAPFSQSLIGSVGDCRVDHQHQAGLQSSPQPSPTVFAGYNLSRGIHETLSVRFGLRLLPCGDY